MANTKPTIIFVPGAWHTPEGFGDVIGHLKSHGYKCVGVNLPSVGAKPPTKNWDSDRDAISKAIVDSADNGEDVVVIMHSYGGFPGSEGVKGLSKKDREAKGQKGGVARLLYMTAFMVPEGVSLLQAIGGEPMPWFDIQGDTVYATKSDDIFYNDMDAEAQKKWISKLESFSYPNMHASAVEYAAWKHIPTSYLVCEDDHAIPVQGQQGMIQGARDVGVAIDVHTLNASHSPFLSKPKETADIIRKVAGENI